MHREIIDEQKIVVEKLKRSRALARPRREWEDNFKITFQREVENI
jgi:hypothetical protein